MRLKQAIPCQNACRMSGVVGQSPLLVEIHPNQKLHRLETELWLSACFSQLLQRWPWRVSKREEKKTQQGSQLLAKLAMS